jgi:uncharacterized Zn finger protein
VAGRTPTPSAFRFDWAVSPTCTCPDARRRAKEHNEGYCKHIIAVLLSNQDLRCQLMELFL